MASSAQDGLFTAVLAAYAGVVGRGARVRSRARARRHRSAARRALTRSARGSATCGSRPTATTSCALARDVEALRRAWRARSTRARALERARRELLAAISHDVRTPLTSLRLLSEALDDDLVDGSTRREYVSRIGVHVRALGALIDDLFELSPARGRRHQLDDGARPARGSRARDRRRDARAGRGRLGLDARRADRRPRRCAREPRADPARSFQPDPERDQAHARRRQRHGQRRGPPRRGRGRGRSTPAEGIPPPSASGSSTRSCRAAAGRRAPTASAGLGLAISRAIVEAHGGRIWIADARVGTSVRFSLPWPVSGARPD